MSDVKGEPTTVDATQPVIERRASRASRGSNPQDDADAEELGHFGYEQELRRDWGLMHNFGISFSIIVRLPACIPLPPIISHTKLTRA